MTPVDINIASAEELTAVKGLGELLAEAIVAHRDRHGPFRTVDDLTAVDGISQRLLAKLRDQLTVGVASGESVDVLLRKPDGAPGDFAGHTVALSGTRTAELGNVPFAASAPAVENGLLTVPVPTRSSLVGDVQFKVLAPDGKVLATHREAGPRLPRRVAIDIAPSTFGTTQPNADPAAGRPSRVRGQVIDAAGRRPAGGLQVVLWGASVDAPGAADFRALVVVTTDRAGHFSGPYPVGAFTAAHATVGLDGVPVTVPVHLVGNLFPESVVLVVDLPEPVDDDDCECHAPADAPRSPDAADLGRADGTFSTDAGAGRCVDFTKPDRTLEEYSFSYVVRTTEPEIRGLVLDEPRKVPRALLDRFLPGLVAEPIARALARDAAPAEDSRLRRPVTETDAVRAESEQVPGGPQVALDARVLRSLTRDPQGLTTDRLASAARLSLHADLQRYLSSTVAREPGRRRLTGADAIDWDADATVYQAVTIAHGHVLRFKQEWVADGYSMGNLLYSLPLAPGQKKQLAVVDWERRETTARQEFRESRDQLEASVERDRDISEIVAGTLNESTRGGSSASTGGFGAGLGVAGIFGSVGGLLGVGGGFASADSNAWQNSSRSTSANALNSLRDRTVQAASSVRSQRTSVVHTVAQGERVSATTESVANYNHCHAITIQYFEVLRHLLVRQRLVDVQECLFVPMLMSWFTRDKALRWRNTLTGATPRALRGGYPALERIDAGYVGSDLPTGRYADENLEAVEGDLTLRFQITRPRDKDEDFDPGAWMPLITLFGLNAADFYAQHLRDQKIKDRIFLEQLGPRIAGTLVSLLRVKAVRSDESEVDLRIDPTLLSTFTNDRGLAVSLRMSGALPPVRRGDIKAVRISAKMALPGTPFMYQVLPAGSRVIVEAGSLRYRTAHLSHALFQDASVRNDLTGTDDVRIETPLSRQELRNPREEDKELARNLLDHLNEHLERYHHVLWSRMSDDRRYMLLDGFEAPGSDGRSVASVVENELIGIVGNSLVMPVARGFHLDPTFSQDAEKPVDLLEHYAPNTPIEPSRVAVPTRGVYAEAVMGACNSCEVIDETRFWRWEESPIPDSPTQLLPVSTDSRRATPADVTPTAFPAPIIAMQSAPAAPDPTGVGAALTLLGQSGAFRDITGLEGNQRNAAAALQQAMETATTFGTKAADLALQGKMSKDIDKAIKTIGAAKSQGLIDDKQAASLTETAIRGMVGAGTTNPKESTTISDVETITKTAGAEKAAVSVTRPTGEKVEVDARGTGRDDTSRPVIMLSGDTATPELRSFRPGAGDKTLVVEVAATHRGAPDGARLRWSSPSAGALSVDNPDAERTKVRGVRPGTHDLDVELLDAGGTRIASMKLKMSVPQCVRVAEDAAAFDQMLSDSQITGQKNAVVDHMKQVVEHVLSRANTRVFWQLGGLSETVPAHVPAGHVVVATVRDKDPGGRLLGVTTGPVTGDSFDEKINLFPGMYSQPNAVDVDTETQALIVQLESSLVSDLALTVIATKVFGRLIGETLAHEIGHALLWDDIAGTGHNSPAIAHDLMNAGVERPFIERSGMQNTAQVSPVEPEHYVDHGLGRINRFQPANQALLDRQWPVPPAFG